MVELERLRSDSGYAALVVKEAHRLVERGFGQPIIAQLFEADTNPGIWEDLIWSEICSTKLGYRVAPHGQWILDLMAGSQISKEAIGKAARKFLYDPRSTQAVISEEAQSWLALLADEASDLTDVELADLATGSTLSTNRPTSRWSPGSEEHQRITAVEGVTSNHRNRSKIKSSPRCRRRSSNFSSSHGRRILYILSSAP